MRAMAGSLSATLLLTTLFIMVASSEETRPPTITLDRGIHFTAPDGSDVQVLPGAYRVEAAGDSRLRLIPAEGKEAVLVQAMMTNHQEDIASPVALSIPGGEDEHHLVLLLPGGPGLDTAGSYSGVRARGSSPPPLPQTQLQAALMQSKTGGLKPSTATPPALSQQGKPLFDRSRERHHGDGVGWTQYRGNAQKTGRTMSGFGLPKGQVAWRMEIGPMNDSSPVVAPDGTIYVGTEDTARALVSINPNGTRNWAIPVGNQKVRATPAIRSDGSLVVASYVGAATIGPLGSEKVTRWEGKGLVSLVSPAGAILNIQDLESVGLSSPALDGDGNAYQAFISQSKNCHAIWKLDRAFNKTLLCGTSPVITGSSGLCIGCYSTPDGPFDGALGFPILFPSTAIDRQAIPQHLVGTSYETFRVKTDGFGVWEKDFRGLTTPAIHAATGNSYLVTGDKLELWDRTGRRLWSKSFSADPKIYVAPPALGSLLPTNDDLRRQVYAPGSDGFLYSFDDTGTLLWKRQVGDRMVGAPVVISNLGAEEIIVVGSDWNVLSAMAPSGRALWTIPLDSAALGSPAVTGGWIEGQQGSAYCRIYVATRTSLYAIQ